MLLEKSLCAWGSPQFEQTIKAEVAQAATLLPLQQALSQGNHVLDEPITVTINRITELDDRIQIRAGIFYQGLIAGCSCADDPSGGGETNEYCDVLLEINKINAETTVSLLED